MPPGEYKSALKEMACLDFPEYFKSEKKIAGRSDLYTYFYIRSLHLLNAKGIHVFICSNSWLGVGYGAWVQEFLLKNVPMHYIIDNHAKRSFASSDINTIITVFDAPTDDIASVNHHLTKFIAFKQPFEDVILTENLQEIEDTKTIVANERFRVYPISVKKLLEEGTEKESEMDIGTYIGDKWGGKYLRAPDIFFTILTKGKDKLVKLKDIAEVRFGIKTGANVFLLDAPGTRK